jgi:hypothetical protein
MMDPILYYLGAQYQLLQSVALQVFLKTIRTALDAMVVLAVAVDLKAALRQPALVEAMVMGSQVQHNKVIPVVQVQERSLVFKVAVAAQGAKARRVFQTVTVG